jgi:hypothetical protein
MIKGFNMLKGALARLSPATESMSHRCMAVEAEKKALGDDIIIAIGRATHACCHAVSSQKREIGFCRVHTSTIRMVEQPYSRAAMNLALSCQVHCISRLLLMYSSISISLSLHPGLLASPPQRG